MRTNNQQGPSKNGYPGQLALFDAPTTHQELAAENDEANPLNQVAEMLHIFVGDADLRATILAGKAGWHAKYYKIETTTPDEHAYWMAGFVAGLEQATRCVEKGAYGYMYSDSLLDIDEEELPFDEDGLPDEDWFDAFDVYDCPTKTVDEVIAKRNKAA